MPDFLALGPSADQSEAVGSEGTRAVIDFGGPDELGPRALRVVQEVGQCRHRAVAGQDAQRDSSCFADLLVVVGEKRLDHTLEPRFLLTRSRFTDLRKLDDPALAEALPLIAAEITWQHRRESKRAAATSGIIHGDLFRDNVIFAGAELVALIDFEQASAGSLAYDLAVCICAWCYTDHFLPELIGAMVEGYCGRRPLLDVDREALFIEARNAALRFAVTRITDIHLANLGP